MENQTNISKFKVINTSPQDTVGIDTLLNRHYEYANEGKMIDLNFRTAGFTKHHITRINIVKNTLEKLQQFRSLSQHNKRKIYNAFLIQLSFIKLFRYI